MIVWPAKRKIDGPRRNWSGTGKNGRFLAFRLESEPLVADPANHQAHDGPSILTRSGRMRCRAGDFDYQDCDWFARRGVGRGGFSGDELNDPVR